MSGPRPAQQSASAPSITTAGTDRMPRDSARSATLLSRMSRMMISQDGQAASPNLIDYLFTDSAAGAENLDLSLGSHANSLLILKGYDTG